MKRQINPHPDSERTDVAWEAAIQRRAATLLYPTTPNIAASVRDRLANRPRSQKRVTMRLAWSLLLALLVVIAGLLLSPPIRAALLEFLQIGAVRIQLAEPTQSPTSAAALPTPPTATPQFLTSWLDLSGETTLQEARGKLSIPLRLPAHPADLGAPDHVFVQKVGGSGSFALFIWLESDVSQRPRLTLMQMEPAAFITKGQPETLAEATVHGSQALWTSGPYALVYRSSGTQFVRLIDGHVLIWSEQVAGQEVTYRLESDLTMAEAVKVAESLRDIVD